MLVQNSSQHQIFYPNILDITDENRQRKDSDKYGLSIYRNITYSNGFQHYLNCLLFLTKAYKCKLIRIDKYKLYKQKGHTTKQQCTSKL